MNHKEPTSFRLKFSDLWRLDGEISRSSYLAWGILLVGIKFNLDRLICRHFDEPEKLWDVHYIWTRYLWQSLPQTKLEPVHYWLLAACVPFLWCGALLTLRRLRSAGLKAPWLLMFFVPVLKLIFFSALCVLPARAPMEAGVERGKLGNWLARLVPHSKWGSAIASVLIVASATALCVWAEIAYFRDYGWSVFVGAPFIMGFLAALFDSYHEARSLRRCVAVANCTVVLVGLGFLLFAVEGILCLLMAAPLAFPVATIGGTMAYAVQRNVRLCAGTSKLYCAAFLILPLSMGVEHFVPPPLPLLEVTSSVIVQAPPSKVWKHVVTFSELPPPHEAIFKSGIAYPIRAEIRGSGVGAIRYCQFSTGPFVEPIEVWDEPRLLGFSVTQNPEPMQEWTPYRQIHPPHLDGYLESRRGQFRLTPLDGGRTLLEGTTWYHHHLWPAPYWQVWSDHIIHTIHLRVLRHVQTLAETPES